MKFLNIVKSTVLFASLLCIFTAASSFNDKDTRPQQTKKKTFVVVLDPGHGGPALGAVGRKSKEKDIVLDISKKLKTALESRLTDVNVILTRTTDVNVGFSTRTDIANKNHADLFISVHANSVAGRNPRAKGTETFVVGYNKSSSDQEVAIRENADLLLDENNQDDFGGFDPKDPASYIIFKFLKNQYREQSIKLASYMQTEYTKSGRINRGVKEAGFAVLIRPGMPAVLTEIGFISNPDEEDFMMSDAGQKEIVENLFQAIKSYKTAVGK